MPEPKIDFEKVVKKEKLDLLELADVYSLILFILYKVKEIPEYAVVSELCYMFDANSIIRLLTYFGGQTIKIPTCEDLAIVSNALLLYQYVCIDGLKLLDAVKKLQNLSVDQKKKVLNLYTKIIPIMADYNIDKAKGCYHHEVSERR